MDQEPVSPSPTPPPYPRPTWLWSQHSQTWSSPILSGEAPVAPRPLLFVLRNGNLGPLGQESSARERNPGFAVPHSQPGPAASPPRGWMRSCG